MKSRTVIIMVLLAAGTLLVSCSKGGYQAAVRSDAAAGTEMSGSTSHETAAVPSPYTDEYKGRQSKRLAKQ